MSLPVSACLLSKACVSEEAYARILKRMKFNAMVGAFTVWPCHHQPRCPMPSLELIKEFKARLKKDLASELTDRLQEE
jgi:hypothetical protein